MAKANADYQIALSLSPDLDAGLARPAQNLARVRLAALSAVESGRFKETAERYAKEAAKAREKSEATKIASVDYEKAEYEARLKAEGEARAKRIAERREQEEQLCAEGFARVNGECKHNAPSEPVPNSRLKILETGYSLLKDIGGEERGYGLYSYAMLVNNNDRSAKFLNDVFGDMSNTTPPIEETAALPSQTNILYITLKRNKAKEWSKRLKLGKQAALRAYANNFYDYKVSRTLLNHLCVSPAKEIKSVCEGDLSRGPYIFAYAKPASKVTPVPPPFLFMDLSDVHERAFPEFIAAFKAQVKREDISDRAKIDTLRLNVLNIVLTTADWLVPVRKAVADIVYSAGGQTEKDKK